MDRERNTVYCNVQLISHSKTILKKAEVKRADYSARWPPVFFNKEFGGSGNHCVVTIPLPMSFLDYAGVGQQF